MEYGICNLSVVPVRAEPSDKSEQVTQLLFGECYEVLEKKGNWFKIKIALDHYEGWLDFKQHFQVSEKYFGEWQQQQHPRTAAHCHFITSGSVSFPATPGAVLPFYKNGHVQIGEQTYTYNGKITDLHKTTEKDITEFARLFIKSPYLWGGKSLFGIDCSGLVQVVFAMCGFKLPRDAYQQVAFGSEVHFVDQAKPGDLAFFDNAEGRIIHVGIMMSNSQILHAHGEVRIDTLDHEGIYNSTRKTYSHKLRIIKRIF